MAKGKVQITAEQFGEQYIKMFNEGFNPETGETSATINDVAAFFGMKPNVAYQKVVQINKRLKESGSSKQMPKMAMSNAERKNRINLTALAALAASAKTRDLLSQID